MVKKKKELTRTERESREPMVVVAITMPKWMKESAKRAAWNGRESLSAYVRRQIGAKP